MNRVLIVQEGELYRIDFMRVTIECLKNGVMMVAIMLYNMIVISQLFKNKNFNFILGDVRDEYGVRRTVRSG
jgi:hypothetical protein